MSPFVNYPTPSQQHKQALIKVLLSKFYFRAALVVVVDDSFEHLNLLGQ